MITELAPAKINLALHVTGQRADGYHLLDSLVAFTELGDRLTLRPSPVALRDISVNGPFASGVPTGAENLILKAASLFRPPVKCQIELEKNLPHAAGIGGGSSDAAAALRLFQRHQKRPQPTQKELLSLGADVPVCAVNTTMRMQGIGEILSPAPELPPLWLVLANPGVAVPTRDVFERLARRDNAPMDLPAWENPEQFLGWLLKQRNDMQPFACQIAPVIGNVLDALAATNGCEISRMSGSGSTCFGLYLSEKQAAEAAVRLSNEHPDWWVKNTRFLSN